MNAFLESRVPAQRVRDISDENVSINTFIERLEETERALQTMREVGRETIYPSPAALQAYLQQDKQVYPIERYQTLPFASRESRDALIAALNQAREKLGDPILTSRPTMSVKFQYLYAVLVHASVTRLTALEKRRELTHERLERIYAKLDQDPRASRELTTVEGDIALSRRAPRTSSDDNAVATKALAVLDKYIPDVLTKTEPVVPEPVIAATTSSTATTTTTTTTVTAPSVTVKAEPTSTAAYADAEDIGE